MVDVFNRRIVGIITAVYFSNSRSPFPGLEARFILENLKPLLLAALKEAVQTRGIITIQCCSYIFGCEPNH
jgi:hypothetical protein